MQLDTKELLHPVLTFWMLEKPKCCGCCHETMFWSSCFLSSYIFMWCVSLRGHKPNPRQTWTPFPLPSVYAYSILMGACLCLGTRCYQRAYAWLHRLIPCSRLVNMFTCISLRSLNRSPSILLPLWEKTKNKPWDECDSDGNDSTAFVNSTLILNQ